MWKDFVVCLCTWISWCYCKEVKYFEKSFTFKYVFFISKALICIPDITFAELYFFKISHQRRRSLTLKFKYQNTPDIWFSFGTSNLLMFSHFVQPDTIWMKHTCTIPSSMCAWIFTVPRAAVLCESLLCEKNKSIITIKSNEWMNGLQSYVSEGLCTETSFFISC